MDHSVTFLKREYYKRLREYQMRLKQISCQFIQTDVQDWIKCFYMVSILKIKIML